MRAMMNIAGLRGLGLADAMPPDPTDYGIGLFVPPDMQPLQPGQYSSTTPASSLAPGGSGNSAGQTLILGVPLNTILMIAAAAAILYFVLKESKS